MNGVMGGFPDLDTDLAAFQPPGDDLAIAFAENFVTLQGQFSFCLDVTELRQQIEQLFTRKDWHRIYCADPVLRGLLRFDWYDELASCNAAIPACHCFCRTRPQPCARRAAAASRGSAAS